MAALGALIIFVIDETIGKPLFPRVSIITVHVISISIVAALTFLVLCCAVPHRDALLETRRQPDMSEDANRLLLPLLATMREGILIVNSRLDIILYNDAATNIVRGRDSTPRSSTRIVRCNALCECFLAVEYYRFDI